MQAPRIRDSRVLTWFAVLVVVCAGMGFLFKIVEFIRTMLSNEIEGFALISVSTYLVVAVGYLCLFIWSYLQGHYRDVEGPKYWLLEHEAELDAEHARTGTILYHG